MTKYYLSVKCSRTFPQILDLLGNDHFSTTYYPDGNVSYNTRYYHDKDNAKIVQKRILKKKYKSVISAEIEEWLRLG